MEEVLIKLREAAEIKSTIAKHESTFWLKISEAVGAYQKSWGLYIEPQYISGALNAIKHVDPITVIENFIDRVELDHNGISLTISLASLVPVKDAQIIIHHEIPMRIKRRGVEMRMVIGNTGPVRIDSLLIRAVAKAHGWIEELASGKVKSLIEIAKREGISKRSSGEHSTIRTKIQKVFE